MPLSDTLQLAVQAAILDFLDASLTRIMVCHFSSINSNHARCSHAYDNCTSESSCSTITLVMAKRLAYNDVAMLQISESFSI